MKLKNQKIIFTAIYCLIFLVYIFLFLPANKVYAALEVNYPKLQPIGNGAAPGASLGANSSIPNFIYYLFNAGIFIGFFAVFISLIISGVMFFLSPISASGEFLSRAKDRLSGAVSGLLILMLTYLIITTINPQLFIFRTNPLPNVKITALNNGNPGVYLNKLNNCSDSGVLPLVSGKPDLGADLKGEINSVKIQRDASSGATYLAVLYDTTNYTGKCLYINPNQTSCQQVQPFAASASVFQYDNNPNGDGVYFFRKSSFNAQGGFYYVPNAKINPIYIADLNTLKFQNEPAEEQDCTAYDKNHQCTNRAPQSLAGENISSIKISGSYFVLLSYAGPGETCQSAVNDSCQGFPTPDDVNNIGSPQIKWDAIRNSNDGVPNCVTIIPIKQ